MCCEKCQCWWIQPLRAPLFTTRPVFFSGLENSHNVVFRNENSSSREQPQGTNIKDSKLIITHHIQKLLSSRAIHSTAHEKLCMQQVPGSARTPNVRRFISIRLLFGQLPSAFTLDGPTEATNGSGAPLQATAPFSRQHASVAPPARAWTRLHGHFRRLRGGSDGACATSARAGAHPTLSGQLRDQRSSFGSGCSSRPPARPSEAPPLPHRGHA